MENNRKEFRTIDIYVAKQVFFRIIKQKFHIGDYDYDYYGTNKSQYEIDHKNDKEKYQYYRLPLTKSYLNQVIYEVCSNEKWLKYYNSYYQLKSTVNQIIDLIFNSDKYPLVTTDFIKKHSTNVPDNLDNNLLYLFKYQPYGYEFIPIFNHDDVYIIAYKLGAAYDNLGIKVNKSNIKNEPTRISYQGIGVNDN